MRASIYSGNKQFITVDGKLVPPDKNEVRLEVAYCGVCGTDIHIYKGHMDDRVKIPQIIGHEVSAIIKEKGTEVVDFAIGDAVVIRPIKTGSMLSSDKGYEHISQNLQIIGVDTPGGMQSSLTVPAYTLHKMPVGLSLQHGAMIEPLAVACHDVRLGEVLPGEHCVVMGGGPIGLLIGLVAGTKGAKVILSEVNKSRLRLAEDLGFPTVNPLAEDIRERVANMTDRHMADIVFEVSGSTSAVRDMTAVANKRGRIIMVAIHPDPQPVDLFKLFLSELTLKGARVYERQDFEEAISLATSGIIPLDRLLTQVSPLDELQQIFETIEASPDGMKYLIDCQS